jgi:hypothetical protein
MEGEKLDPRKIFRVEYINAVPGGNRKIQIMICKKLQNVH